MTQEQYGMWLCSIEGIGSQTIRKLINRFGTPEEVYTRTEEQLKEAEIGDRERKLLINGKRQFHYRAMKLKISSYDMDVISYFSERYPEKLRNRDRSIEPWRKTGLFGGIWKRTAAMH